VQPLDLAPCVLVVEFSFRSVVLQASMLIGVEQAVEVEARCPLVLCLQDSLGVVQPDPLDLRGQLTVGACQISVAAFSRRYAELISSMSASLVIGITSPRLWSARLPGVATGVGGVCPCPPDLCPWPSVSLTSTGTPSQLARLLS
jgi:hypothetical protein